VKREIARLETEKKQYLAWNEFSKSATLAREIARLAKHESERDSELRDMEEWLQGRREKGASDSMRAFRARVRIEAAERVRASTGDAAGEGGKRMAFDKPDREPGFTPREQKKLKEAEDEERIRVARMERQRERIDAAIGDRSGRSST
jgi:hypothetical protein